MKTPEEMAEEYAWKHYGYSAINHQLDFLAGYKAGCENTQTQLAVGEKTIRELLGKPQWISVKDRLPSCGVLCAWISDTTQSCIERIEVDDMHPWWEGFDYWCELPAPPKEEE